MSCLRRTFPGTTRRRCFREESTADCAFELGRQKRGDALCSPRPGPGSSRSPQFRGRHFSHAAQGVARQGRSRSHLGHVIPSPHCGGRTRRPLPEITCPLGLRGESRGEVEWPPFGASAQATTGRGRVGADCMQATPCQGGETPVCPAPPPHQPLRQRSPTVTVTVPFRGPRGGSELETPVRSHLLSFFG